MGDAERAGNRSQARAFRYGIAALAVFVGLIVSPGPGLAWADSTTSESTSTSDTTSQTDKPADTPSADSTDTDAKDEDEPEKTAPDTDTSDTDEAPDSDEPSAEDSDDTEPDTDTETTPVDAKSDEPAAPKGTAKKQDPVTTVETTASNHEPQTTPEEDDPAPTGTLKTAALTVETPDTPTEPAETQPAATETTVDVTTPDPPQALSPLAQLLQLPGRIVNAVLQAFGFTTSATSPASPFNFAPINDLLFAVFREVEHFFGFDREVTPQPTVPTLTYTGTSTAQTPTVEQFLNASAAGYGLGTTPGGLVPFVVDGFQLSSTNILSGMVAKTWVTPEGQVIIAYQGTTGGTNLLFNPLIAITQVLTDMQIIFTRTTPWAFYDALNFARRVTAEAAEQGYGTDDIFVTGHSLGGWEAQYVAQRMGLGGIGFESPGINTRVPGNGADSMFVNIETYGDAAPLMSTDLPGLQPFMPPYVPGGGSKPHYGSIIMIGDPDATTPLRNAAALWGKGLIRSLIFTIDFLGNFFQYHLPGVQAYHLGITPDPGVVPWLGTATGTVSNYGDLTIPELLQAASDDGRLYRP